MESKGIVRFIVYAVTLCILYLVINHLNSRDDTVGTSGSEMSYIVKIPSVLKSVSFIVFLLGLIMFAFFIFLKIQGNPTVTNGHIRVALIFILLGLFIIFFVSKWKLTVNGTTMELYRMFHKKEVFQIEEIEKAEEGSKNQITIYKKGRKIVTVDCLCDNYSRLKETLQNYGKIN